MKRILLLSAALCLLRLPVSAASNEAMASNETIDRAALLAGVREIVAPGAIPGDIVIFGGQAFPILTGKMGRADLPVFAATRYGRGRAIAGGHESFFGGGGLQNTDNRAFAVNIARWAGGKPMASLRVALVGQASELQAALKAAGSKAALRRVEDLPGSLAATDVLWLDQASLDGAANAKRREAIRRWTRGGGGLVVTGPGWGWQSVHAAFALSKDQSGNQLLMPMGLAFAGGLLDNSGKRGMVADSNALELTNASAALSALEAQEAGRQKLTPAELNEVTTVLGQAVGGLPEGQNVFVRRVEALCRDKGSAVPTRQTPITSAMPFARLKAILDAQKLRRLSPEQIVAHPSASSFPGAVPVEAKRETRAVSVDTHVPEWHGIGLYAAPGEIVTIMLPASAAGKGLAVRIGPHTDTLWHLDKWERFPEVSTRRPLDAAQTRIASPFGGTLYIEVPENCPLGTIEVTVANAVAAPRFVRGATDVQAWKATIRNAPGPWAELEGKLVILSVPASAVRDLDDPEALMAYWDEVMANCYALYAAPRRNRPERYCVDRQISAGYMHSGYPIMTGDDVAKTFCDVAILRGPVGIKCWGFYHEMGHNFQQPEWTWSDFGEVTNNLFSLYGTETLNGVTVGAHPAMTQTEIAKREQIVAAAPGKTRYYAQDPWYPLTMFWLLRREFGWEPFTRLFAEFRDLPDSQKPKTEAEKHDQFLVRFSKLTGHNLADYLAAWGVETSAAARESVVELPPWMPSDWPKP